MNTVALDAPADKRLMAEFLAALESGDTKARLHTPAFRAKTMTLGDVIADEAGGDRAELVLGCLLRSMARALKSADTNTRLYVMAEAASIGRIFVNTHAEAQDIADAEADDEFRGDYADALRLMDKDARSFDFAAGFPSIRP